MERPIYLDNNATTPLAPAVAEKMSDLLSAYGNPSSAHSLGRAAAEMVAGARLSVAKLLGASGPDEIVFTSGGTESDNWAIKGALAASPDKAHIITTRVEHEAVRRVCESLENEGLARVSWLDVEGGGQLDLQQLSDAIEDDTALVSVMMANNETGVIFPIKEIAEIVHSRSAALLHVDGVNAAGKIAIDVRHLGVDLFSVSAHKFYGPKGIGALYIRGGVELPSFHVGGGQENGRRAGTEAVHQIAGAGVAADLASDLSGIEAIRSRRDKLENAILDSIPQTSVNGTRDPAGRLPNTSNISFEGLNGEMILHMLDEAGICVSTGSACHAGSQGISPVLAAMNVAFAAAMGSIRFSFGRFNNDSDVDAVIDVLPDIIGRLRAMAG